MGKRQGKSGRQTPTGALSGVKRRAETDLQHKQRLALSDVLAASRVDVLVTPETRQHSKYREQTIIDDSGAYALVEKREVNSAFRSMLDRAVITAEQFDAAMEIAVVDEAIRRSVGGGCASMEARVDCSQRSSDGMLVERLSVARLAVTHTRWRAALPAPKSMVLEMIRRDAQLAMVARSYNRSWPWARGVLFDALDRWIGLRELVWRQVDESDLEAVYRRLGEGRLV